MSKKEGGWGFNDMKVFNLALLLKNIWQVVCGDGLWSQIIKAKYLYNMNLIGWICVGTPIPLRISQSWRSLLLTKHWFLENLSWNIGSGSIAKIGLDIFPGVESSHSLSFPLTTFLHDLDIHVLKDIVVISIRSLFSSCWNDARMLSLLEYLAHEWTKYILNLKLFGIIFPPIGGQIMDKLQWNGGLHKGQFIVSEAYSIIHMAK